VKASSAKKMNAYTPQRSDVFISIPEQGEDALEPTADGE
jgi:hypothetical protein